MKISIQCDSALLQKSLELFLKDHLVSFTQSELVIRDRAIYDDKATILIGNGEDAQLKKPFSRSQLYIVIEQHFDKTKKVEEIQNLSEELSTEFKERGEMDFSLLEQRLERLTQEYKNNILTTVKAFLG